jgi:predicted secreted Zn-dependent protease
MNQIGPVEEGTGKRFDGYTKWYVRWNYRYQNQNSRCNITSVRVRTEVTITLPQWKPSRFPAKALSDRWNRYIRALTAHEHQHKNHGIAAHREILQLLQQFPSQPSCPDLETQANAAAHKIIQKYSQKDIEYDRVTRHGAREGTVFP